METILVQMSHKAWTMPALHLACALARPTDARIVLLHVMIVAHPTYLGTAFGDSAPTDQEWDNIEEYKATAEDYDIPLAIQPIQSLSALEAVANAAKQLDVDTVFAHIPHSAIPYWQKFQKWRLQRQLPSSCQLFVPERLDQETGRLPIISVKLVYTLSEKASSHVRP